MALQVITTEDLQQFKEELLTDIKSLYNKEVTFVQKKWLKSEEVKKMLGVSPGTLQNLRINGTLQFTKLGGIIYYDNDHIQKIMDTNTQLAFNHSNAQL